ncbi:MAG: hypothetical protein GQ564_23565 [Bacteroidales bacterium]|nr:hypothetical protein [Bacteroidales bacterium]
MFINYLKIAFQSFWKQGIYTIINIIDLLIGIACFIGINAKAYFAARKNPVDSIRYEY